MSDFEHEHPIFSAEEVKVFGELRLNSMVESLARQREQAYNMAARSDAELAVRNQQVETLTQRVRAQATMLARLGSEVERLKLVEESSTQDLASLNLALDQAREELESHKSTLIPLFTD